MIKREYVTLTFLIKEATWIKLLLIKIDLINKKSQYTKIKVLQRIQKVKQIKAKVIREKKKRSLKRYFWTSNVIASNKNCFFLILLFSLLLSSNILTTLILSKNNNQGLITLA